MTRTYRDWTDTQLDLEHRRLNRWLDLPGSEKWVEEYKQAVSDASAIWNEIKRRKAVKAGEMRKEAA